MMNGNIKSELQHRLASLTDEEVQTHIRHLHEDGYTVIDNFFTVDSFKELLNKFNELSHDKQKLIATKDYGHSVNHEILAKQELINEMVYHDFFTDLANKLVLPFSTQLENQLPIEKSSIKFAMSLKTEAGQATSMHFDQAYINFIIPLIVPSKNGGLILYPNIRNFSRDSYNNILVPLLNRMKLTFLLGKKKYVQYYPNKLYIFWGYRSFHGVHPLADHQEKRAIMNITFRLKHRQFSVNE